MSESKNRVTKKKDVKKRHSDVNNSSRILIARKREDNKYIYTLSQNLYCDNVELVECKTVKLD